MPPSLRPEHLLAAILSSAQNGLLSFGLDGTIHVWSKGAERLYGYTEAEIIGRSLAQLTPGYEVPHYQKFLTSLKEGNPAPHGFSDRSHKSGATIRVSLTHAAVRDEHGGIIAVVESGSRVLCNPAVSSEVPLRSLLEQMPAFLWTTDSNLCITSNWGSGMQLAKVKPGALIGRTAHDVLKCQDIQVAALSQHASALQGTSSRFEFRLQNRDFEIRLDPLRDTCGEIVGCVGAGIDITERKRSEEQARYQATHDALTGLANYREFLEALEREVRRAERAQHSFAVLLLDLDDLKRINDRWGHLTGNRHCGAWRRL
jgi:PAS domain S-box-containing protein